MTLKKNRSTVALFSAWAILQIIPLFCSGSNSNPSGNNKGFFSTCLFNRLSVANAGFKNIIIPPKWPHETSDLQPDPALTFGRLPNGFGYVLLENHRPKNRVSLHLNVQAGSMNETEEQRGLAHFLEHMLFCGSKNFKPGELVKYFQNIGMQFGPDANAHTGFNETVYDILLPEGSRESLEKALLVFHDYAEGALLLQTEIDRERGVILAEKRARDSASYRTFVSTMKFEFPEAKISQRLPIGREDVIKNADRFRLKEYYDTWYRPETMTLVMVGDFDINQAVSLIEEKFVALSARAPPGPDTNFGTINHKGIKPFYHYENETGNTSVAIGTVKKNMPRHDSRTYQQEMLIKNIADRIVQTRLDALIGKSDSPFTAASISSGHYLRQIEYSQIDAECSPENWEKSLSVIEQILRQALIYGFTQSELTRIKKEFLSQLDSAVEKASTRSSQSLSRRIITSLNTNKVFISPSQEQELFAPLIHSLTLDDVHSAFKKTWSPDHRLVVLTGNARICAEHNAARERIRNVYNRSKRTATSKPVETKPVLFPYLPEPDKTGQISNIKNISDLGITQVDFKNGIRLNLKKTAFKANEVLFSLNLSTGRSSEPAEKPGLAELCVEVINESGLGLLKKDELEHALAGKNTDVVFGVNDEHFFFQGATETKEILLLFQLLYAHLTDPGYRKDAYTLSMERFRQKHVSLSSSIDGAMILSGKRFLAGEDSRFGLPAYSVLEKLTLNDIRSWIDPLLKQDPFEISIVGDFDIDTVVETASQYLGTLPQRLCIPAKKQSRKPEFPVAQSIDISVATKIDKGLVVVAYPTDDQWDIDKTRRLSVLSEIFSDRLRESIREKMGASYSPFAYNRPSRVYPGYGIFQAFVHIAPEKSDVIIKEIKGIAANIAARGVTEEELRRALKPTLTSIKDTLRENRYWLHTVLSGSKKYPQQLDWNRTILEGYAAITTSEISILAKQYLDNSKAATIVVKPKKNDG